MSADCPLTVTLPSLTELRKQLDQAHNQADKLALMIRARRLFDQALSQKLGHEEQQEHRSSCCE